jgi:hypothetical protein
VWTTESRDGVMRIFRNPFLFFCAVSVGRQMGRMRRARTLRVSSARRRRRNESRRYTMNAFFLHKQNRV